MKTHVIRHVFHSLIMNGERFSQSSQFPSPDLAASMCFRSERTFILTDNLIVSLE